MQKVLVDTDIGDDIDDAFALAVLMHMDVEIVGVTTVYRNVDLRAKIVLALRDAYGQTFPVAAGLDSPKKEPVKRFSFEQTEADGRPHITHYSEDMAGNSGYTHGAADFILQHAGEDTVLLCLGPCTNIAAAIEKDPVSFRRFKALIVMGGDPTEARAEWNTRCDPEAFAVMLTAGVPVTLVGFDITNRCGIDAARLEKIFALKGAGNALLIRMLKRWISDRPGKIPTMHDPLTAALLEREFCTFGQGCLETILDGPARGKTRRRAGNAVRIAEDVDSEGFLDWMISCLSRPTAEGGAGKA